MNLLVRATWHLRGACLGQWAHVAITHRALAHTHDPDRVTTSPDSALKLQFFPCVRNILREPRGQGGPRLAMYDRGHHIQCQFERHMSTSLTSLENMR